MNTSPAIVTQLAARRLPRWVLLVLGLAYILPGLVGRQPWRHADLTGFGAMLDLAQQPQHWAQPQVLGQALEPSAWLPYWLGASSIRALPWLPADLAARLPSAAMLLLTLMCTWYAMYHLARLPGAQPVTFAFGGEARPVDYARAMADAALLALVASLGLAQLSHETTPSVAQLGFSALQLYALARLVSEHAHWRSFSLLCWWGGAWGLSLSGAPGWAAVLGVGGLLLIGRSPRSLASSQASSQAVQIGLSALGTLLAVATIWWLTDRPITWAPAWDAWFKRDDWAPLGRLLLWFTWPSGALALWTLWRWHRRWREPQLWIPLWWVVAGLGAVFWLGFRGADRVLLLTLPALACLAALALPTLKRTATALIDWFALLFFSAGALIVWVFYVAMLTGTPAKPAANVARQVPDFVAAFDWTQFLPALLATLAWLAVLAWRIGRHRPALWKTLVLSATGSTLCWLLLMTLWLPLLNHGMGQAPISQRIAAVTLPGSCVLVHGLNPAQITGLQYHGQLKVQRWQPNQDRGECTRLVLEPGAFSALPTQALTDWSLMASIPRLRENRDHLMVFERRP